MPEPTRYKKSVAVRPSTASPSIGAGDVDRGVRVVDERELGVGEVGEALAQRVDLLVDVVVGDRVERELDAQLVVADELHLRTDLDDGVELDVAVVLAGVISISGGAMTSTSCSFDRVDVVLRQRVLQRLLARDVAAEARLEQSPRRLAGTEPGDPHVARQLLERGVDRPLELGRRGTTTCSLTLLPSTPRRDLSSGGVVFLATRLDGLDGALHKEEGVYRRSTRKRRRVAYAPHPVAADRP